MSAIPPAVAEAAQRVRDEHDNADLDDDDFVVCKCGVPLPSWDAWGDHYADAMLEAAVGALNGEPNHIIELRDDGWTLKHPLSCRADDLFKCPVNRAAIAQLDGPPEKGPGRYQVALCDDGTLTIGQRTS